MDYSQLKKDFKKRFEDGRFEALEWIGHALQSKLVTKSPAELCAIYNQSVFSGTKAIIADVMASGPGDHGAKLDSKNIREYRDVPSEAMVQDVLLVRHAMKKKNIADGYLDGAKMRGWKTEFALQHLKLMLAATDVYDIPELRVGFVTFADPMAKITEKIGHHFDSKSQRKYLGLSDFAEGIRMFPQTEAAFDSVIAPVRM